MAEENKVVFKCQKCSKPFIVRQGSRRRYCDDCLVERISHKGEKEGRDGKGNTRRKTSERSKGPRVSPQAE